MSFQSEAILEKNLVSQLASNGYEKVTIQDEEQLLREGLRRRGEG